MIGQKPQFRRFLSMLMQRKVENEQAAAVAVREYCKVKSRRELNSNPAAADSYRELIRLFNRWMNNEPLN